MAEMIDQMVEDRKQEKEEIKKERSEIKKERGQAKKWRKSQIDQRLKEIGSRIDKIEEDLRNIPDWRESALNFQWGEDFGGRVETILTMQYDKPLFDRRFTASIHS